MTNEDKTPRRYPEGFDPRTDVLLDARSLRGMAHPLRPQILGLLRSEGPLTATRVAERLGESSAAMSYHLRQLAVYGFIEEDEGRGTTRERWWRAVYDRTWFDPGLVHQENADFDPGETAVLADDYLQHILALYSVKIRRWLDNRHTLSPEWTEGSTMSDSMLRLTADESKRLLDELKQVIDKYRAAADTDAPEGARIVTAQFQVFPQFLPGDVRDDAP